MRAIPGQDKLRATTTRRMQADLEAVFERMQADVAAKVRRNAKHLETHPNDTAVWWDQARWERELSRALRPAALNAAEATVEKVDAQLGA
jgi:hypothetical protein